MRSLENRIRAITLGATMAALAAGGSHAATLAIRPITLASGPNYSMVVTGTITTVGSSSTISGWNAVVTTGSRITQYTPANTSNMSLGPVFCDGTRILVATSPDGFQDGGELFFRSPSPYQDVGVALADFTGMNTAGGQAMYMAGAAFDFLPLNQPNNTSYVAATRASGNVYNVTPIDFYGGVRVSGTITTDGTIGSLLPSHILSWNIVVDQVTEDLFSNANSALLSSLVGLDGTGTALTVQNPNGYLTFSKGYQGGHLYGLMLADFSSQSPSGGQAGYFQGAMAVTTVNLNAPAGPWLVTEVSAANVGDPVAMGNGTDLRISPNPARGATQVHYRLAADGPVQVELFDLGGRRVRQVTDAPRSAGGHAIAVDVGDLPSGVYFCRLAAEGRSETAKLLVQR